MPCAWCSAGLDITCFIVGVVTSLQAGVFGVWFLAGGRTVFFSPKSHLLFSGYQVSSPGMKLATHLHLVPRFRISRAVPLLLLCTFVVWSWVYCGTWVFITAFTTAQYWMVLRASTIQFTYACIVCRRPPFQGPSFTFCTFYLIRHICVPCLSCPWLLIHTNVVILAWSVYFCTPSQLSWAYE
jgi:hypothetical protein